MVNYGPEGCSRSGGRLRCSSIEKQHITSTTHRNASPSISDSPSLPAMVFIIHPHIPRHTIKQRISCPTCPNRKKINKLATVPTAMHGPRMRGWTRAANASLWAYQMHPVREHINKKTAYRFFTRDLIDATTVGSCFLGQCSLEFEFIQYN